MRLNGQTILKQNKKLASFVAAAAFLASLAASFVVYMVIRENGQGEAFDTVSGIYEYRYLLKVFSIVFIEILLFILCISGTFRIIVFIFRKFDSHGGG